MLLLLHGSQMKAERDARGMGRGGYWKGRLFVWQRAWKEKVRKADLGELRLRNVLQSLELQSGACSGEGSQSSTGLGRPTPKTPHVCSARLRVETGLVCPKPHATKLGLQSSDKSQLGAELGVGAHGGSRAKPPERVGWGPALAEQQKAGLQFGLVLPLSEGCLSLKSCASFCTSASERPRDHLRCLVKHCSCRAKPWGCLARHRDKDRLWSEPR